MEEDDFVSAVNKRDMLLVLLFSVAIGVLNELVSWFFIYRKDTFKKGFAELCDAYEVFVLSRVIPLTKTQIQTQQTPSRILLQKSQNIKGNNTITNVITGLLLMGLMPAVMNMFEYSVVAKLPFKPIPLISMMTHSSNLGNDVSDCNATAVYTVISMLARQYTKVLLGYEPPFSGFRESVLNEEIKKERKL